MNDKPERMPNVPPFVRFVASAVPMVFDNSLSYYEALCALWKYIQGMTDVINNNATLEEEYIRKFDELKSFVDNYFDNLDVQEEINNKLDAMVEDGTLQELINSFLQANVAWVFDNVSDMAASENLIAGSYARTLGFHAANDGGGGLYKISDSGIANGMDVIVVNSTLYASLIYGNRINVKQLGAYGDNTNDDSTIFSRAATLAASASLPLYAPKAVYKLTSEIDLRHLVVKCEGTLNNAVPLILGGNSNASTNTDVEIFKCDDVTVKGAKNSYFKIIHCGDLVLSADGTDSTNTSIAYNKFEGVEVASITITGSNSGWVNENIFNIKRDLSGITITGDGTYIHNNNVFPDICIEGADKTITINYGHHNYIYYRGESYPSMVFNTDPSKCFGNLVQRRISSIWSNLIASGDINEVDTINFYGANAYLPTMKCTELFHIDKRNAKKIDAQVYVNDLGQVTGSWAYEYTNENIPADKPFIILLESSSNSQRLYIDCYDSDGNIVSANVAGPGISKNNSTNEYYTANNVNRCIATYTPTDGVVRIKLMFRTGPSMSFDWAKAELYTPFLNIDDYTNEIDYSRKTYNNIPSTLTAFNQTWAVGDIVWNSAPTAGGTLAWVCVTAGTGASSVWKTISVNS